MEDNFTILFLYMFEISQEVKKEEDGIGGENESDSNVGC